MGDVLGNANEVALYDSSNNELPVAEGSALTGTNKGLIAVGKDSSGDSRFFKTAVDGTLQADIINNLVPVRFDEISLAYTGANLTTVLYKLVGVTQATLSLGYSGNQLVSVVRS